MAHQTSPNLKIPACASLTPRNPTSSSAAIGWTTQLIPRPLSCAVCVRSTTDGKCLVYAHCPQEMQTIIPHCNKQLVGSLPKDCVRNQIFMTLKIPCYSSSLEKKDFNNLSFYSSASYTNSDRTCKIVYSLFSSYKSGSRVFSPPCDVD